MKSQVLGLRVAGTIFAVLSLGHVLRLLTCASLVIAGQQIPLWISGGGVLITGALGLWMWKLSFQSTDKQKA
jgi:hypothetical protein